MSYSGRKEAAKKIKKRLGLGPEYGTVFVSPSRLADFAGEKSSCARKWWFGSVCYLPNPKIKAQTFGTALHAVAERWARADDNGVDPETGRPVELYPPGWEAPLGFDGKPDGDPLTPTEQSLVKNLIAQAIKEGALQRLPDREIEKDVYHEMAVVDKADGLCATCGRDEAGHQDHWCGEYRPRKGYVVILNGKLDYATPDMVRDIKTCKDFKYALGPKRLARDSKMLLYGHTQVKECQDTGRPAPAKITLEHHYYCKNPNRPAIKVSPATVSANDCKAQWERSAAYARQMEMIRAKFGKDASQWPHVPGAMDDGDVSPCNSYGGCPFIDVCAGQITPDTYRERFERRAKKLAKNPPPAPRPKIEESKMKRLSFVNRLKAATQGTLKEERPETPPAAAVEEPTEVHPAEAHEPATAPSPAAPAPEKSTSDSPPWAIEDCTACQGKGLNKDGDFCGVCKKLGVDYGKLPTTLFEIESDAGKVRWSRIEGTESGDVVVAETAKVREERHFEMIEGVKVRETVDLPTAKRGRPRKSGPWGKEAANAKAHQDLTAGLEDAIVTTETAEPITLDDVPARNETKAEVTVEFSKEGVKAVPVERPAPKAAPTSAPTTAPATAPATDKGFHICVGCLPCPGEIRFAGDVLAKIGAEMAEDSKVDSYWMLNAFNRRDMLRAAGEDILKHVPAGSYVCFSARPNPDEAVLLDALREYADTVFQALA